MNLNNINNETKELIKKRLNEFKQKKSEKELFNELCFCILTANFNAERSIRIQKEIKDGFIKLPQNELANKLRTLGHRFPNTRAKYIVEARAHAQKLKEVIIQENPREWIASNIKGLGMKEASHFLRNIGLENYAIIDFHIIDLLEREGLIIKPKNLNKKKYLEIEEVLKKISKESGLNLASLDLNLWYLETGKVLK